MVEFQLTPIEMILFALAVVASLFFGYKGFKKVYLIIKRGQGDFPAREIPGRLWNAAVQWIGLLPTWRARPGAILHARADRLGLHVLLPGQRAGRAARLHRLDDSRRPSATSTG